MKGTPMKKIISFILSFFLLTAAGCGEEKTADTQDMRVLNLFSWADNFPPKYWRTLKRNTTAKSTMTYSEVTKNFLQKSTPAAHGTTSSSRRTTWYLPF